MSKLRNLVSSDLKKQLYTLATNTEWGHLPVEKRQRITRGFIAKHRLGEKVTKFIQSGQHRPFVLGDMPKPKIASQWVADHATALSSEQPIRPMAAFKESLTEIFGFYGMPETRSTELFQAFDSFQLQ